MLDPVLARPSLTLAAIGAAALLLLGEGIARLAGDRVCTGTPGHVIQADAALGWTYVPHLHASVVRCDGPPMRPAVLETDARGLPMAGVEQPKPPGVVRVLLLGGMSADGVGVRPAYRLGPRTEALADARLGTRLEVVNVSIAGYTLDNDLLVWREVGPALQPDVVLVMLDPSGELTNVSRGLIGAQGRNAPAKRWMTLANDQLAIGVAPPPPPAPPAATGLAARSALVRRLGDVPAHTGPPLVFAPAPAPAEDQLPQEHLRSRALVRRLLETFKTETAAAGARFGVVLAPIPGEWASRVRAAPRDWLASTAEDLDIPTLDLRETFGFPDVNEGAMFLPGTMRWSANGHSGAAFALLQFLTGRRLVPETVRFTTGAQAFPTPAELPSRAAAALADAPVIRFLLWGLVAIALVWLSAPLPAAARDWVLVLASLLVIAMVGTPTTALVAVGVVLAYYVAVELLPWRLGRPIGWLVALAPFAAILGPEPMPRPGAYGDERLFPAVAAALLLLRLALYGAERRAGAPSTGLAQYLAAVLFFPTIAAPPIISPFAWVRLRGAGLVDVSSAAALRAHLRRSGVALGGLALGMAKLVLAPLLLGLVTPEVFVEGGLRLSHARLWLWVLELPLLLYLLISGVSDVAIAFAALVGVGLPADFDAPWRVTGPVDLWRRTNRSFGEALRRLVYRPLGGSRRHATRNVLAVFLAGGVWWLAIMVAFAGLFFYPPRSWWQPLCTALLLALGVLVARRAATALPRGLAVAATYLFVALAVVPLFVPGWVDPAALGAVLLRLAFLR